MKYIVTLIGIIFIIMLININKQTHIQINYKKIANDEFRYVSLGDSYTIGLGVNENERWPNLVTNKYNTINSDKKIRLIANLAVSGHTTEDVIRYQLPDLSSYKPDVVTLLIGANDNFMNTDIRLFKKNYETIIINALKQLSNKKNLILINLPDHSISPSLNNYSEVKNVNKLVNDYNSAIQELSQRYGLYTIDLYSISHKNTSDDYFIFDGLHPSALGYEEWSKIIAKTFIEYIK